MNNNNTNIAFIPELGTYLKLNKDWGFTVYPEHRNEIFLRAIEPKVTDADFHYSSKSTFPVTLPQGTVLLMDRIYVRKGAEEYSSVSMYIIETTSPEISVLKKKKIPFERKKEKVYCRFWVKLDDYNSAGFESISIDKPESKPASGDIHSLGSFKRRGREFYVEFTHPDPAYCFSGPVNEKNCENIHSQYDCFGMEIDEQELEKRYTKADNPYNPGKFIFTPKFLMRSFVPPSWYKRESENPLFAKNIFDRFLQRAMKIPVHPLDSQINISTDKKIRQVLCLKTDKSLLENIKIAGGELTVRKPAEN